MSSTYPSSGVNPLVGLGLLGCDADKRDSNSPTTKPATPEHPAGPISPLSPTEVVADRRADAVQETIAAQAPVVPPASTQTGADLKTSGRQPSPVSVPGVTVHHRIGEVREAQGLTERTVAKRIGIDIRSYRQLECATTDLSLSQLSAVQHALDVPLVDLLVDDQSLSRPVSERAKMVKTMKTAVAIRETKPAGRVGKLATMLCEQLVDLMPELADVSGWPQFGARRGASAVGRVLAQPIDTSELHAD